LRVERQAQATDETLEELRRAERRALRVIALDWAAILILLFFHDRGQTFLPLGGTIDTLFSLGILAVAVHSGFRLGQLEKLKAVGTACRDILQRDAEN
jgi:hypothetical protein